MHLDRTDVQRLRSILELDNYRLCDREIVQKRQDRAIGRFQKERQSSCGQRSGVPLPRGTQHPPLDVSQLGRQQSDLALHLRTKSHAEQQRNGRVIN